MADVHAKAERLRALHHGPSMLVLPNAWDGESARAVEKGGFPVVATSSGAVARMLGRSDGEAMTPDEAFGAVAIVARSVTVPVTADMEAGYGLPADEFVARLLEAGAVGCNYEDTDHIGGGTTLVDAETQAGRLAAIKDAGRRAGVDIVLNARIDTFIRPAVADPLGEALRRGRLYRDAGADCLYPIGAHDEADIRRLVAEMDRPVNVIIRPDSPSLTRLQELGVARTSLGSGLHRVAMERVRQELATLHI